MLDPASLFECPTEGNADTHRLSCSSRQVNARRARGFTLTELLITMAVMVILSCIAAASMSTTLSSNRIYATQAEFVASLALARSEATRRGLPVIVSATAPVTGNAFGGGWSVWVDRNNMGVFTSGDEVLRTHEALPSTLALVSTSNAIAYGPLGFLAPAGAIDLKVCPSSGSQNAYDIAVLPNGLADVTEIAPGGANSASLGVGGINVSCP